MCLGTDFIYSVFVVYVTKFCPGRSKLTSERT